MIGDFDTDGDIDVDDLRTFMEAWRHPDPPADSLADLNADGILDYLDLEAFIDLMLAANPPKHQPKTLQTGEATVTPQESPRRRLSARDI